MSNLTVKEYELQWNQLQAIQDECSALSNSAAKNLGDVFKFSMAYQRLEQTLTPELVAFVILPMRNKEGGWREDRPGHYNIEEIRNVMTSAIFKGAVPANDEILIISGRFYAQKPFFTRKLAELPDFSELILQPGEVKLSTQGALVEYSATWKYKSRAMSMSRTGKSAIPCKLQNGQGADAALGKAERKIKCAIYNQLTGSNFEEREHDEVVIEGVASVSGVVVTEDSDAQAANTQQATAPQAKLEAPPVSQTKAVSEKLKQRKPEAAVAATSGPKPWEGEATPAATTSPAAEKTPAVSASASQTAATPAVVNQARQPAPPPQPGPGGKTAPAATPTPATTAAASVLPPAPKFDGQGSDEVNDATLKVVKIFGKKPPHRIQLEDNVEYWTKDTTKAEKAKELMSTGAPAYMEYITDERGFRIVIDIKAADFSESGEQQPPEDQSDFGS